MSAASPQCIVPLISSEVAGPLEVLHLPRLWQKLSLHAAGRLAPGYDDCGHGFDQMTIDSLGLNREELISFIQEKRPSYVEFERWVSSRPGIKLDQSSIEKHNEAVRTYQHPDETRKEILSRVGLSDDKPTDAPSLNNLDDWDEFHRALYRA